MMRWLFSALAPAGNKARLTVLIFHRVLPEPDPLFPGEATAETFARQLGWLTRWFNVLPLADAVDGLRRGSLPARPAVITFDDGYGDNATAALPILQSFRVPATFFVATGFLDGGQMWNDAIIETLRRYDGESLDLGSVGLACFPTATLPQRRAAIDTIIGRLKYLSLEARAGAVDSIAETAGVELPKDLMMTSAQVRQLAGAGMTIGAHTVRHPILASIPEAEARKEMADGRDRLQEITGGPIRFFAYPNGKPRVDYTRTHVRLAREIGFQAAVSTAWGVATADSDLFQIPRFTPWDRRRWRYGLRLANNMRLAGPVDQA